MTTKIPGISPTVGWPLKYNGWDIEANRLFQYGVIMSQLTVLSVGINVPPLTPAEGDFYVVGSSPTGTFTGQAYNVAAYYTLEGASAPSWQFFTPKIGQTCSLRDDSVNRKVWRYNGPTEGWVDWTIPWQAQGTSIANLQTAVTALADALTAQASLIATLQQDYDIFTDLYVSQFGVNTPPTLPPDGMKIVVGTSPTGVFATHANSVGIYHEVSTSWELITPKTGQTCRTAEDEGLSIHLFNGSEWKDVTPSYPAP